MKNSWKWRYRLYSYFKGKLVSSTSTQVVLEVNGIGYLFFISVNSLPLLPSLGSELKLHTSFVVRELSNSLYGFLTFQERDAFEALLNVTGIGPKLGLALIGHLSVGELQVAVRQADTTTLSRVPGVGKKTAERLIIELRDKLSHLIPELEIGKGEVNHDPRLQHINDAMGALINLGYHQQIAQKAIKKTLQDFPETITLAELITHALKNT